MNELKSEIEFQFGITRGSQTESRTIQITVGDERKLSKQIWLDKTHIDQANCEDVRFIKGTESTKRGENDPDVGDDGKTK